MTCRIAGLLLLTTLTWAGEAVPATRSEAQVLGAALALVDVPALRRAVDHLATTAPERCAALRDGWRTELDRVAAELEVLRRDCAAGKAAALARAREVQALKRAILFSDPLLDGLEILAVRRHLTRNGLGMPANWEGNSSLPRHGWDDALMRLTLTAETKATTVFKPEKGAFVGDVKLHWDATRVLFAMPGANGRFQVHELALADGAQPKELPFINEPDVDNYDACWLPDGDLLFVSTATMTGVHCVRGGSHIGNLFRWNRASGAIRRLTVDQEHNWTPVVLHDGRIMYQRWEYSDIPHFASRLLFVMNPDGTGQNEHYGSNSYWPNSIFYAQPVPGHQTLIAGIVGGHHGVPRMGELVLFDPAKGRHETSGVVQRIPGFGKPVEATVLDHLVDRSWPKFLHPCPLGAHLHLVAMQPHAQAAWGIYLADTHDNLLLLQDEPGCAWLEPVALRARPVPPVIPSRVPEKDAPTTATVAIADIYRGAPMAGVPRGTVKRLRIFTYHFAYRGMGGQIDRVGTDGPWDIKAVLGTVPVEEDGSAHFTVPANTPFAMQPLDADDRAVALMRSWTTAMPGEVVSCVGCHESRNTAPLPRAPLANTRAPSPLTPWYGPVRGFSFAREVQPVLDRHCVSCHSGKADGAAPDFTDRPPVPVACRSRTYADNSVFPPSYHELRRWIRTATIEKDLHVTMPYDVHASTSILVQMLEAGHHGVRLDREDWDRLATWIDLNAPAQGTWTAIAGPKRTDAQRQRRVEMLKRYANRTDDLEVIPPAPAPRPAVAPAPVPPIPAVPTDPPGWPLASEQAKALQAQHGSTTRVLDLGGGVAMELVWIPAGTGRLGGTGPMEAPPRIATIAKGFWLGRTEVTNAQFARFDPAHDSGRDHRDFLQFSDEERGRFLNQPQQPVCRVPPGQAAAFCRWLSQRAGFAVTLPDEDRWEWACRADAATPWHWGPGGFTAHANLADASFQQVSTFQPWKLPSEAIPIWRIADAGQDDRHVVSAPVGTFAANAWGLVDMHGNVREWTASRDDRGRIIARGGSWSDRPDRATAAHRVAYQPWQGVFDVGFRVMGTD